MSREGIPNRAEEVSPNERKQTLKEKAAFQLKEFLAMFFYIWVLSALADMHETIILAQAHLNYQAQGFAIVNALILAKIMLIGEDLHLGNRFREGAYLLDLVQVVDIHRLPCRFSHPRRGDSWSVQGNAHF